MCACVCVYRNGRWCAERWNRIKAGELGFASSTPTLPSSEHIINGEKLATDGIEIKRIVIVHFVSLMVIYFSVFFFALAHFFLLNYYKRLRSIASRSRLASRPWIMMREHTGFCGGKSSKQFLACHESARCQRHRPQRVSISLSLSLWCSVYFYFSSISRLTMNMHTCILMPHRLLDLINNFPLSCARYGEHAHI